MNIWGMSSARNPGADMWITRVLMCERMGNNYNGRTVKGLGK
jgi:hypothetical protein